MSMRSATVPEFLDEAPEAGGETDTFSVIDRHSSFDGTFRSDRDLRIEGEVKGTIECQGTLFVAQGATVTAQVNAENVTVAGDLNGEVRCHGRLQMMPSGRVRAKVATETLVINEGAYYEGQLEMPAPEDRGKAPRAINAGSNSPVPISQPTSDGGRSSGSTTFIRRLGQPETPWAVVPEDDSGDGDREEAGDEPK